jgi:predicted nuclease of predicted toxin-antitoxin system
MAEIKIYLDEDVHPFVAQALRLRGWDALTTVEAGRRSSTDRDQLAFAASQGYSLLTYNVGDFGRLHAELLAAGDTHAGIIVATQDDPRRNIRALLRLLNSATAETMTDALIYLTNCA